jgi:hypothetical protein
MTRRMVISTSGNKRDAPIMVDKRVRYTSISTYPISYTVRPDELKN